MPARAGELGLGQPQGQAAFADCLADQERPAGLGVPLAVLVAVTALGGEFLIGGVLRGHSVHLPVEHLVGCAVLGFADLLGLHGAGYLRGLGSAGLGKHGQ